jgi:micrococcal nuclease
MKKALIILLLLSLTACTKQLPCDHPVTTTGEPVVCVIDGDTIRLKDGMSVRFIGMDTPERGLRGAAEATATTISLINNSDVRFEKDVSDKDKFGRYLRYIYANDVFVDAELVRRGWAIAKDFPPDLAKSEELHKLDREAKDARIGLWAIKGHCPYHPATLCD